MQNEEAPAKMLENVALFCDYGGLDAIKDCFENDQYQMPVSLASCLISVIAQVSFKLSNFCVCFYFLVYMVVGNFGNQSLVLSS